MTRDGFGNPEDEFTGKTGKQLGSIALILHAAQIHTCEIEPGPVNEATLLQAIGWLEFFEGHWKKIMSLAKQTSPASMLADRIVKGDVIEGMKVRELERKQWSGLRTAAQVGTALRGLEEAGWLRLEDVSEGSRPSLAVRLNPNLKPGQVGDTDE